MAYGTNVDSPGFAEPRIDIQLALNSEYTPALQKGATLEKTHVSGPQRVVMPDGIAAVGLVATQDIPAFSMVLSGPTHLIEKTQWIEVKTLGNWPPIWQVPAADENYVFFDHQLNNTSLDAFGQHSGNPVIPMLMPTCVFDDNWDSLQGEKIHGLPKWVLLQQGLQEFGKFPNIEPVVVRDIFGQYSIQYQSWSNTIRMGDVLYVDYNKIHGAYVCKHPMYPLLYTPFVFDMTVALHEQAMRDEGKSSFSAVANSDFPELDIDAIEEDAKNSDSEEAWGMHADMPWLIDYDKEGNPVSMY